MANDNLRGRYRRDFTRERIGGSAPTQPAPVPAQPHQPVHHQPRTAPSLPGKDLLPALTEIKAAKNTHRNIAKKKRRSFKKLFLFILILVLVAGLATGGYLLTKDRKQVVQKVPANIQQKATVPILYPNKLPPDYSVVQQSFNMSAGGVVAYYAEDNSGHRLNFTVQPRPANFDFESFYTKILTNATRFSTPVGEAAVGTANGHLLGSLAATKSWVIVSANSKAVTAGEFQTALSGIQEIHASK